MEVNVVQKVIEEQARRKMKAREMAKLLGISESSWSRIKSGERKPSGEFYRAVLEHLPYLIG